MRYAFYVSGRAGRLSSLIEKDSEVLNYTELIITDSVDALYLKEQLEKKNIAFDHFDYETQKQIYRKETNRALSDFLLKKFIENRIDYCFCFGDHILKGRLLEMFHNRIINFHPSILPLFPGRNAIDQAMKDRTTILLGNTAHFIDQGVDTGPILMQSIINKSYFELGGYEAILNLQIPMLEEIFRKLETKQLEVKGEKIKLVRPDKESPSFYFY